MLHECIQPTPRLCFFLQKQVVASPVHLVFCSKNSENVPFRAKKQEKDLFHSLFVKNQRIGEIVGSSVKCMDSIWHSLFEARVVMAFIHAFNGRVEFSSLQPFQPRGRRGRTSLLSLPHAHEFFTLRSSPLCLCFFAKYLTLQPIENHLFQKSY